MPTTQNSELTYSPAVDLAKPTGMKPAVVTSVQLANGFIATSGDTNGVAIKQACGWIADGIAQTANNYVVGLKKKAHK